jgi:hypothetical protein
MGENIEGRADQYAPAATSLFHQPEARVPGSP